MKKKRVLIVLIILVLTFFLLEIEKNKSSEKEVRIENFERKNNEIDDTARIQRAIEFAKKNSNTKIILEKGKKYYISSTIELIDAENLVIIGDGATIYFQSNLKSNEGAIRAFSVKGSNKIKLENLKIENINQENEYTGLYITKSSNVKIYNLNIQKATWAGIAIFDSLEGNSNNIEINNATVEYSRFGIVSNGYDISIKNSYISNHWSKSQEAQKQGEKPIWVDKPVDSRFYDGIIIKGENWSITNSIITDNGQSGIYSGETNDGLISGNTITENWNKGIDLGATKVKNVSSIFNISIENNVVIDNKTGQIHFSNVENSKIINNEVATIDTSYENIPSYKQPVIILNHASIGNIISDNKVIQKYNGVPGIFLNKFSDKSINNTLENNQIKASTKYEIDPISNTMRE